MYVWPLVTVIRCVGPSNREKRLQEMRYKQSAFCSNYSSSSSLMASLSPMIFGAFAAAATAAGNWSSPPPILDDTGDRKVMDSLKVGRDCKE
jgi:hypothetical protein